MVALVLGGGGAKGAFQVGALMYMREQVFPKLDFGIIAGVSVGCLNGGMLAMNDYAGMVDLWTSIDNSSIYSGTGWLSIAWSVLRHRSVYSNAPLAKIVAEKFSLAKMQRDFRMGFTSLITGEYCSAKLSDFASDDDFRKAVLASTTMPVIWEPVDTITFKGETREEGQCVDGGLRNVTPIGDVLEANPDVVVVINCSDVQEAEDPGAGNTILTIAQRSLVDIAINQNVVSDVKDFLKTNELVRQAEAKGIQLVKSDGTPYKQYEHYLIEPTTDLGDSLDFSQASIKMRIAAGYSAAKAAFTVEPPLQQGLNFKRVDKW